MTKCGKSIMSVSQSGTQPERIYVGNGKVWLEGVLAGLH